MIRPPSVWVFGIVILVNVPEVRLGSHSGMFESGWLTMDSTRLFDELVAVARKLDVAVRLEPLSTVVTTGGGLCTLGGRTLVLIDLQAPLWARVEVLARALARLETDEVYMTPEARDIVTLHQASASGNP